MTRPIITRTGGYLPATWDDPEEQLWYTCPSCERTEGVDRADGWYDTGVHMLCPECSPDADWHRLIGILYVDDVRGFVRRVATMAPTALVRAETETWA